MAWPNSIQEKPYIDDTGTTHSSVTVTLTSNITAGSLVVVMIGYGTNQTGQSVVDGGSRSFTHASAAKIYDATNGQGQTAYYYENHPGGTNQITVNFSPSTAYTRVHVMEFAGGLSSGSLDGAVSALTASTATNGLSSGNITTTANGNLIVGWVQNNSGGAGTLAAGTGFTAGLTETNNQFMSEARVQSSAGSIAATFTASAANGYGVTILAFKAATGGSSFSATLTATNTVSASNLKTVSALKSASATLSAVNTKLVQAIKSATQTRTATLTAIKTKLLTLTASVASSAVIIKLIQAVRSATQGTTANSLKTVGKITSATTAKSAVTVKAVNAIRTATQSTTATLSTLKAKLITLTASVTSSAIIIKTIGAMRSATQAHSVTVVKTISATKALTQISAASLQKTISMIRSATVSTIAAASLITILASKISPIIRKLSSSNEKIAMIGGVASAQYPNTQHLTTVGGDLDKGLFVLLIQDP